MSTKAGQLAKDAAGTDQELPYGRNKNEIGVLSRAFNNLLRETRTRVAREHDEHIRQVQAREVMLKTIGHEIRSPLQSLLALHPTSDESRHQIDRMVRAVNSLFGGSSPESAFASVPISMQLTDVAKFLSELVSNASAAESPIHDVKCVGVEHAHCNLDPDVFEEVVSHILSNADRLRDKASPIVIDVSVSANEVCIRIRNDGPRIPEEMLERIFDFGTSLNGSSDGSSRGQGLFVVRNYVGRMAGKVYAVNLPTGVEFTITFPAVDAGGG